MSAQTKAPLTSRQRLARGLTYSAVGPVDVTRGVVGLGVHSAKTGASSLRRRYRQGRPARELAAARDAIADELAAARGVVAGLPAAVEETRRSQRRNKRPWIIAGVAASVLAGGAAAFSVARRKSRPEPSPRPPSVEVQPRP